MNKKIPNNWYDEIVHFICKPGAQIIFIIDKSQILDFPQIKEEVQKNYPIIKKFRSEIELRSLLKKISDKIIVIFKDEIEVPYDLQSKIIIFNIRHLLEEIFRNIDCEELLEFPIEIYQKIFDNYNMVKSKFFEKMSKPDTHNFVKNLIPEDYKRRKAQVENIISKLKNINESDIKTIDWGKVSIIFGELMYYLDNNNFSNDFDKIKLELNEKFVHFIKEGYEDLIYNNKSLINSNLINIIYDDIKKKKAIICFDCMGFEEWFALKDFFKNKNYLDFEINYSFSILPSETNYSSLAIFSGMIPKDIKTLDFIKQINWRYEEKVFKHNLTKKFNFNENNIFFERCLRSDELSVSFGSFMDYNVIGLVFSFIDQISHRPKMNKKYLLRNIKLELENSNIYELIKTLVQQDFDTYLVSDHGNIFSVGNGINVSRELFDNQAKRYLISEREILLKEYNEKIKNSLLVQFKNLIGNEYLLLLSGNTMFGSSNDSALTHGGISIEEVIVPFIRVIKK